MKKTVKRVKLSLNGEEKAFTIDASDTLVEFLRDTAELAGTREGCGGGECGACTVLLDGIAVNSCLTMAVQVEGRSVTTIEGITSDPQYAPLVEEFAARAPDCSAGVIVSAAALLAKNQTPSDEEIIRALDGHTCTCVGYKELVDSVKTASRRIVARKGSL